MNWLKQSCIPGIILILSWYLILFTYCWVRFAWICWVFWHLWTILVFLFVQCLLLFKYEDGAGFTEWQEAFPLFPSSRTGSFFRKYLDGVSSENILTQLFLFWNFITYWSISKTHIGLYRLSVSSYVNLGRLCLLRNWSSLSRLLKLWTYCYSLYSFFILLMSPGSVVMPFSSFLILVNYLLSLFSLVNLARNLLIFF